MNYKELEKKYNFKSFYKEIVKVDLNNIPNDLHFFKPYIEFFVSESQGEREFFMGKAPIEAFKDLDKLLFSYINEIENWLAGPEASMKFFSKEYIYFSIMRLMSLEDCKDL
jgi:hypothetical protein